MISFVYADETNANLNSNEVVCGESFEPGYHSGTLTVRPGVIILQSDDLQFHVFNVIEELCSSRRSEPEVAMHILFQARIVNRIYSSLSA